MQQNQGQKYVANLFFSGLGVDVNPEMLDQKTGAYLEAHCMQMSRTAKNILRTMRGDKSFSIGSLPSGTTTATIYLIGGIWVAGYVVTLYRDSGTDLTYIYCNGTIIGTHADYPNAFCDIDSNDETLELVITDNSTVPIVLSIRDMLDHKLDQTYFADYDVKLYSVNKDIQVNQPVFTQLEDLGAGAGLKFGSYSYAVAYSSVSGESTPWGPATSYIPVPESAVSLISNGVESYAAGLKTWGGETSLVAGRYGIRLRLRIANISGFDYIKIKRLANNTGQPISYTPAAEFMILTTDASGGLIDIKADPYSIIEFIDSDSLAWAMLDDSVFQTYSTIKTARTARFYDRRIILGGVEYESKLMTAEDKSDMFLTEPGVNRIAFPIIKLLDSGKLAGGFSSIYNQVYNKAHRLGERYGFAAKLYDGQGNTLFTVPMKHGEEQRDDFTNFQFPNRREKIPVGVKRVDTITIDGTIGSADIVVSGVTGAVIFRTDLITTALDFVTDYAADYLAADVEVAAYQNKLIFTSTIAGQDFTGTTSITTAADGDLDGTVLTTQANVVPIRQVDKILLEDAVGDAIVTVTVSGTSVTRTIISTGDAMDAAIAFAATTDVINGFATIGVEVSVTTEGDGGIILTGPWAGTAMLTTASGSLISGASAVFTSVYPVLGVGRIDRIRLSANIGSATILCNGVARTAVFHISNTQTAAEFVSAHAAAYLPQIVLTSSGDTLIFTGVSTGLNFTGPTSCTTHTESNLTGSITPLQANVLPIRQVDIVLFNETGATDSTITSGPSGLELTRTISSGGTGSAAAVQFISDHYSDYLNLAGVTISYVATGFGGVAFTGPADGTPITTVAVGTRVTGSTVVPTVRNPVVGLGRIDKIVLSANIGSANILCNGVTRIATFHLTNTLTATEFVSNHAAAYLPQIEVTADSGTLIFTTASGYEGVDFTGPTSCTPTSVGSLAGTFTPAKQTAHEYGRVQVDVVELIDQIGYEELTCQGVQMTVNCSGGDLQSVLQGLVANPIYIAAYAAVGVTINYFPGGDGGIVFTGVTMGASITTTVYGNILSSAYTLTTPSNGVPQVSTITLTGSTGSAYINCDGLIKGITYETSLSDTAAKFVTDYASDYLSLRNIVVTNIGEDLIFTDLTAVAPFVTITIATVASNLTGTVIYFRGVVPAVAQVDVVTLIGTAGDVTVICEGLSRTTSFDTDLPTTAAKFVTDHAAAYAAAPYYVIVTSSGPTIVFTGPVAGTPITTTVSGTLVDNIFTITAAAYGVAQIDLLTFLGTIGSAYVVCNGLTRGITFNTSLATTATQFVADYYSAFAASGIDIDDSGDSVIFTALNPGVPFSTTINNTSSNLTGEVTYPQTPTAATSQVDIVTLSGASGSVTITCQGIARSVSFNISLDITAINFVTNYSTVYAAAGVTITYSGSTIIFTGPAAGTVITTTATGTLVDNIYTVYTPVPGTSQIDKVTITGSAGNITVSCDGLVKGITYDTSTTQTAANFVIQHAAAYLALRNIEVTSVNADLFFRALLAGDPFVTTVDQVSSDVDGIIEYTRANSAGGSEALYSTGVLEDSTTASWAGEDVGFVYDPVKARRLPKANGNLSTPKELNIISVADPTGGLVKPYEPITPTGRGGSPRNNNYDDILTANIMDTVDTVDNFGVGQYGKFISTIGLRIGGIDTTKLPPSVKAFSIVRTPAAGRVVCQGIGMYAMVNALEKSLDKLWFYSPELDSVIGNKSHIYEDIKTNPSNYTIQLVAPCGFFSDMYSSYVYAPDYLYQDMASMPICGAGADARPMFPPDSAETNYISFGKWRNETLQGAGLVDSNLEFIITAAQDVSHAKVRVPYLELSLSTEIYANADVLAETSATAQSKEFHEPWYIINIIQNKVVPNNNINSYNDIGHSIRIESILGLSNGEASQTFPLVEERPEDVYSLNDTATTYRYIWMDGLPWLDSNNLTDIADYLIDLESAGEFTPTDGLLCYGIYTYNATDNAITFDQVLPTSLTPVVPVSGAQIMIKYNSNSPIEIFLGDTYIADATFLAVDASMETITNLFELNAPMPHYAFEFKTSYHQAKDGLAVTHATIWDDQGTHHMDYLRQWLVSFTCESSVNLPLAYKNFFPSRLYAMRPLIFEDKQDNETVDEYLIGMNIYPEYDDDYPGEYLNWKYGGLSTPSSMNYDYEKALPLKSYTEPKSGANEILTRKKRIHWTTQSIPGFAYNRVFTPTNAYDLKNDKASQISILYDDFSERGNNLYVITDRGVGMLLTDKQMITTAEGNNLTILSNEASLVKGEVWLNSSIGCPKEFWRGKSEGAVKLPNNIVASILVFPSQDDIVMLSNNSLIQIADNNRAAILTSLESIDLTGDFVTKLYSVIDQGENKLWLTIGTTTYAFNFDQNNWDGSVKSISFDKSFNAKYLTGVNDRNVLAHALNKTGQFGLSISHKSPVRFSTIGDVPYAVFSVTPELGRAVEFVDMFISASDVPYSVEMATNKEFTNSITVLGTSLQEYKPGLYYMQRIPRTADAKAPQAKTLFVKIRFAGTSLFYDLRMTKVGYKIISGN